MTIDTKYDALDRLWQSSADLYARFNMATPNTLDQLRVVHEECYELTQAAHEYQFGKGMGDHVTEEAADVIVTVMGVLMSCGATYAELASAIGRVAAKNDAKTHETHAVSEVTGKITRRSKL